MNKNSIDRIVVGTTNPHNNNALWLDTNEGEKKAILKYKGNAVKDKEAQDKIAELTAKVEELESSKYVEIFISASENSSFVWPFETTLLSEIEFLGYSSANMVDSNKILKSGLTIQNYNASEFSEYYDDDYGWWGDIQSLEKGKWYTISNASISVGYLAHVYIRPRQQ